MLIALQVIYFTKQNKKNIMHTYLLPFQVCYILLVMLLIIYDISRCSLYQSVCLSVYVRRSVRLLVFRAVRVCHS